MPLPKGDVHKKKEVIQDVTLHDLDVANARPQVGGGWADWGRALMITVKHRPINKICMFLLMDTKI